MVRGISEELAKVGQEDGLEAGDLGVRGSGGRHDLPRSRGDGPRIDEFLEVISLDADDAADTDYRDFSSVNPSAEGGERYVGAFGALFEGKKL